MQAPKCSTPSHWLSGVSFLSPVTTPFSKLPSKIKLRELNCLQFDSCCRVSSQQQLRAGCRPHLPNQRLHLSLLRHRHLLYHRFQGHTEIWQLHRQVSVSQNNSAFSKIPHQVSSWGLFFCLPQQHPDAAECLWSSGEQHHAWQLLSRSRRAHCITSRYHQWFVAARMWPQYSSQPGESLSVHLEATHLPHFCSAKRWKLLRRVWRELAWPSSSSLRPLPRCLSLPCGPCSSSSCSSASASPQCSAAWRAWWFRCRTSISCRVPGPKKFFAVTFYNVLHKWLLFCLIFSALSNFDEGFCIIVIFSGLVCVVSFGLGLIFATRSGSYWLALFDNFAGSIPLLVIGFCEMFAVIYVYGIDR